eukprot:1691692-Amphidinium_carterae.1
MKKVRRHNGRAHLPRKVLLYCEHDLAAGAYSHGKDVKRKEWFTHPDSRNAVLVCNAVTFVLRGVVWAIGCTWVIAVLNSLFT